MRYQLCGPVTGRPREEAVAEFGAAAERIAERHPDAQLFVPTVVVEENATHERAMRVCLGWLLRYAEALVVLPGWETSKGARMEVALARAIGVPVLTVEEALR